MAKNPPSTGETSKEIFQNLAQFAPDAIRAIADTTPYTAQKELAVEQATAPGYAGLQNQITRDYGPEAARIGSEIDRQNQLAAAQTEVDLSKGPGRELVSQALKEQQTLDPEFYANRAILGDAINKYLSSYSPTQLTNSELEQINRGISGREGPMTPSQIRTVRNAQTFGNAATQRWQNFGNAVLQASSALPSLKSGLTGFEIATRRPLVSNVGTERLSTPTALNPTSAFNTNFGFANNALNNIGNIANTRLGMTKTTLDRIIGGTEAFKNVASGVGSLAAAGAAAGGCWVAREIYGNDNPDWEVFRFWLMTKAPAWFRKLYIKYGERFATFIHKFPMFKPPIRRWMDSKIKEVVYA